MTTPADDAIHAFAAHVAGTWLDGLPESAIAAAKTFILDTLSVGISGSAGPMAAEVRRSMAGQGKGNEARVWGTGEHLPAAAAALCNAYQAHCQEYDCVHEAAVAHVMTCVLPAAMAGAERQGGVAGPKLIEAVVLGVDVAAGLGVAAISGLRFFRPGTAGAFGATAALGKLMGFDAARMVEAFSLVYGQLGGTMQAHTEGSGLLALQMGFNARNAVMACDLAAAGLTGPKGVLEGDFGYFRLIEDGGDLGPVLGDLGRVWRIAEIAHKPFPSGRATHGILDGCLSLQREHGYAASDVKAVRLTVPPLIRHLVGRPPRRVMEINYARLSARYVLAAALQDGHLALTDFTPASYERDNVQALANRISLSVQDDGDPNALVPIGIEIDLADGRMLSRRVRHVYGCPENPMSREAQVAKAHACCADPLKPLSEDQTGALIGMVDALETVEDVAALVDLTVSA